MPTTYSDGGYTGANIDPCVRQLLADIEADKIDCVVVYKEGYAESAKVVRTTKNARNLAFSASQNGFRPILPVLYTTNARGNGITLQSTRIRYPP